LEPSFAMFLADCSVIPMLRLPRRSSNLGRSDCATCSYKTSRVIVCNV